jgi:hypothetical protein
VALCLACLAVPSHAQLSLQPEPDVAAQDTPEVCIVQHDDRTVQEMGVSEQMLGNRNRAVCEGTPQCKYMRTYEPIDRSFEPHWQKLLAIKNALDSGCQHAVWLDSDAVLHTLQPLDLIQSFAGKPVFVCGDPPAHLTPRFKIHQNAKMNAGIFGFSNTDGGRKVLAKWIDLYPKHLWSVQKGTAKQQVGCITRRPDAPDAMRATSVKPHRFAALLNLAVSGQRAADGLPSNATEAAATAAAAAADTAATHDAPPQAAVTQTAPPVPQAAAQHKPHLDPAFAAALKRKLARDAKCGKQMAYVRATHPPLFERLSC